MLLKLRIKVIRSPARQSVVDSFHRKVNPTSRIVYSYGGVACREWKAIVSALPVASMHESCFFSPNDSNRSCGFCSPTMPGRFQRRGRGRTLATHYGAPPIKYFFPPILTTGVFVMFVFWPPTRPDKSVYAECHKHGFPSNSTSIDFIIPRLVSLNSKQS